MNRNERSKWTLVNSQSASSLPSCLSVCLSISNRVSHSFTHSLALLRSDNFIIFLTFSQWAALSRLLPAYNHPFSLSFWRLGTTKHRPCLPVSNDARLCVSFARKFVLQPICNAVLCASTSSLVFSITLKAKKVNLTSK